MTKREEGWTVNDIVTTCVLCCLMYSAGIIVLLYFKSLFGIGLIIAPTLVFIPALIEARIKVKRYLKEKRIEKLRKNQETVVIGGIPQEHHHHKKKNKQPAIFDYYIPVIDDETSKGKLMKELGLWYEKPTKRSSFEENKEDTAILRSMKERISLMRSLII